MITDKNKEYLIGVFLARGKDALLWHVNSLMEESYNKGYDSGYDDGNTRYK